MKAKKKIEIEDEHRYQYCKYYLSTNTQVDTQILRVKHLSLQTINLRYKKGYTRVYV